jgi:hypothetical protein
LLRLRIQIQVTGMLTQPRWLRIDMQEHHQVRRNGAYVYWNPAGSCY